MKKKIEKRDWKKAKKIITNCEPMDKKFFIDENEMIDKKIKTCKVCGVELESVCPNEWTIRDEEAFDSGVAYGKSITKLDKDKIKYFSFITTTKKHGKRRVIPVNKLKECVRK